MKNTVIFDLDGTLLDTLDDLTGSANFALKEKEGVRKKPAPDTLFKALDQLESRAEDSVYVGDSEVDLNAPST